jgi:hypothetical protein
MNQQARRALESQTAQRTPGYESQSQVQCPPALIAPIATSMQPQQRQAQYPQQQRGDEVSPMHSAQARLRKVPKFTAYSAPPISSNHIHNSRKIICLPQQAWTIRFLSPMQRRGAFEALTAWGRMMQESMPRLSEWDAAWILIYDEGKKLDEMETAWFRWFTDARNGSPEARQAQLHQTQIH